MNKRQSNHLQSSNKRVMENFIKAGAMDGFEGNRCQKMAVVLKSVLMSVSLILLGQRLIDTIMNIDWMNSSV